MAVYTYSRVPAFNPNTSPVSVAKSATGSVYDIGDTGFLTALTLTLVASNTATTTLVSDANGMFPDFTLLDRTQCVFKSGALVFVLTTTTPIPGPTGAASTVAGPAGPATTDASLLAAGTVADARLPTRLQDTALAAAYVGQGKELLNLNIQPGVDMTGNTECGAAVQTAINLASTRGLILIGSGQITSASALTIVDNVDLTRVVLNYTGPSTTTAITVGNSGGIVRKDIKLPYVVNLNKTAGNTGWGMVGVVGTVGVSILNAGTCRITVPAIYKFETGLLVTGNTSKGSVYNIVTLGEIVDNKVNVKFIAPAGYCNQNTFIAGRLAHSGVDTSFTVGTRHVLMANGAASEIAQGNTFVGTCLESPDFVEFQVEAWGMNNQFLDCSWETNTNTSRVVWRGTAAGNQIIGGVQTPTLIVTADAGATANDIVAATRKNYSSAILFTGPNYDVGGTAGGGVDQPRYLRVNTAVQTGYGTTHPPAATAGIGANRYDTGIGKPVFSNGGAWYRADTYLKTTKTASYSILTTDVYDCYVFNGASLTATLPDPGNAAQDVRITVKNINASALVVNSAGASKTLDGAVSQSLGQWAKATYVSDGTQWLTV